jgi:asparagine synthase (glutamine-hydrolysing)
LGAWWSTDHRVGLGHRRLAIIDLSPGGHQPMADATGTLHIVFNGEIYNFQDIRRELEARGHLFRSQSDTEVILEAYRAWGIDCLERLNGMFAFALHDASSSTVFIARDRAGEKPLYYRHADGSLAFGSELKALMEFPGFPRELDVDALNFYLAYGYVPGARSMLSGVSKLPAAHALVHDYRTDRMRIWRYWDLPAPFSGPVPAIDDLADELQALLADAVGRQLVADVPVGVLLSGGIDSSLVTAMAARASSRPVKTFTVSLPGHRSYDEGPYARLVAHQFGTEHHELVAEPASVELLPQLARQYDEPIGDQSIVPTYLVSRLIRQSATVALGGDGGDELFGGYASYSWVLRHQRARRYMPPTVRRIVSRSAAPLPVGFRGRTYLLSLELDTAMALAHANLFFDHQTRLALAPALHASEAQAPEQFRICCASRGGSIIQQLTSADFRSYLPDDILVKVDRASMLTSLEVRAPFLDHRIVTFAFGRVPDAYRTTPVARKILLRHLARRLLPPALDLKRKQGFVLPLSTWFRGEWGRLIEDVLHEADPTIFDRRVIHRLLARQRQGFSNAQRLFLLVMFELWRREYRIATPAG